MPVGAHYIAGRVSRAPLCLVKAYVRWVLDDVLPTFSTLSARARAFADAEFDRLSRQLDPDEDDGSVAADQAEGAGQTFFNTLFAIRQGSLNLFAVGLFHLLEQQLADLCRDGAFPVRPPNDTKLDLTTTWLAKNFALDLSALPAWPDIDQLRLLANTVKHGEGSSATQLRVVRPDLFEDPNLRAVLPDIPWLYTSKIALHPISGEDVFVTQEVFESFGQAAIQLLEQIAAHFHERTGTYYFAEG